MLSPLLESILDQYFNDFDVLICEDKSPERDAISGVFDCDIDIMSFALGQNNLRLHRMPEGG